MCLFGMYSRALCSCFSPTPLAESFNNMFILFDFSADSFNFSTLYKHFRNNILIFFKNWAKTKNINLLLMTDPTLGHLQSSSICLFTVRNVQDKLHATEQKLHETESNQADRVDKSLLKNLLIGYIAAPNNDKSQILKLISSVLDFNQQESDKVGLNRSHSSWLNSIMHGNGNASTNRQGEFWLFKSSMLKKILWGFLGRIYTWAYLFVNWFKILLGFNANEGLKTHFTYPKAAKSSTNITTLNTNNFFEFFFFF